MLVGSHRWRFDLSVPMTLSDLERRDRMGQFFQAFYLITLVTWDVVVVAQTGSESSVDRLMKQITSFMSEIPDEFKVVVVQAIRSVVSR